MKNRPRKLEELLTKILVNEYVIRLWIATLCHKYGKMWRKERDSNPRNLCRLTRLAVAHNRPLCHLSPHILNLTKWDYSHQYLTTEAKLTQNRLKFTPVEFFEDYSAMTLSHITFTFGTRLVDFGKFGAYFDPISVLTPLTVGHMIVQVLLPVSYTHLTLPTTPYV